MSLSAAMVLGQGSFRLDVNLDVDDSVVAVIGPNGAGKTTLLRALAGLVPLEAGKVVVDGRVLEDPAAGIRVRSEDRRIGVVFQDHRLFPHLTALENVAFGLRAQGIPRVEARRRAATWLDRVGLPDMARRRPADLSGGEAQRVALARTLVTEPAVLLLDEPLAAVDASARTQLRGMLRDEIRRHAGARLVVTHDPIEAAALAEWLVVLEDGRVVQQGPLVEVTARPRSAWVADMIGLNLLSGSAEGTTVSLPDGPTVTVAPPGHRGPVFVAFRPSAVTLHRRPPEGSARNVWFGQVSELYPTGDRARVRVAGPVPLVAEVTAAAVAELHLGEGGPIWAAVKATEIDMYPS